MEKTRRPLAVVTGASSGIGYELAREFAEHGFDLVIAAEEASLALAKQAFESYGASVESVQVDLTEFPGMDYLVQRIRSLEVPVKALAINAGIAVSGDFLSTDFKAEMNLIKLNVISSVHLAKHIAKDMVEQGEGRILFTSSIAAVAPTPYFSVYGASKAFLHSFAEAIRYELEGTGVSVTSMLPGATETAIFRRAKMENTQLAAGEKDNPSDIAREGFEALMSGKDLVIPGSFKNKLHSTLGRILPAQAAARLNSRLTKPGSAPS